MNQNKTAPSGFILCALLLAAPRPGKAVPPALSATSDDAGLTIEARGNQVILTGKAERSQRFLTIEIPPMTIGSVELPRYEVRTNTTMGDTAQEKGRLLRRLALYDTPYAVAYEALPDGRALLTFEAPRSLPAPHPDPRMQVRGGTDDDVYEYGGQFILGDTILFRFDPKGLRYDEAGDGQWVTSTVGAQAPPAVDLQAGVLRVRGWTTSLDGATTTRDMCERLAEAINTTPGSGYEATVDRIVSESGAFIGDAVTLRPRPGITVLKE